MSSNNRFEFADHFRLKAHIGGFKLATAAGPAANDNDLSEPTRPTLRYFCALALPLPVTTFASGLGVALIVAGIGHALGVLG